MTEDDILKTLRWARGELRDTTERPYVGTEDYRCKHFKWQGTSVDLLHMVWNLIQSQQPEDAARLVETYLKHLGEWE